MKQIVTITDPIAELSIREAINKPKSKITKRDLQRISVLSLVYNSGVTDASLKEFAKIDKLKELHLNSTKITDAGLKDIAKLQNLRILSLDDTKITDAGLKEIAKLQQLIDLSLSHTKITNAGLKEIAKMNSLRILGLNGTQITDAGLKELVKLEKLIWLSLNGTQITDAGLKDVAKLKELVTLFLHSCKQITDAGLKELAKIERLNDLVLDNTQITDAGMAELKKALAVRRSLAGMADEPKQPRTVWVPGFITHAITLLVATVGSYEIRAHYYMDAFPWGMLLTFAIGFGSQMPLLYYRIHRKRSSLDSNVALKTFRRALKDERRQQSIFMDSDIYWKQPILSGLIALKSSDLTPMYHSLSDDEVKKIAYKFWARSPTTDAGRDMIKLIAECEELQSVAPMKAVGDDPNVLYVDGL